MAVEIDIEGQRVVISDVATEATLQKLVDKMGGAQSPFGAETVKAGKEFVKQQKEGITTGKKTTVQLKGLASQAGDAASELDKAAEASRGFRNKIGGFFDKLSDAATDVIKFGASMQGQGLGLKELGQSADSLSASLPKILTPLGAFGGAMIAHTANLMDTFQGLSSTGAMFADSMFDLETVAANSYLRLDEMVGVVRENSEALSVFGGSTKLGAKRFSELSVALQNTYRRDLRMLGMGAQESSEMLASFVAINARNAAFGTMSTKQQTAAAAGFAKEMNMMASLTGQDRKQLANKLAQDRRRSDVELKLSRMSGEEQTRARQAFQALEQQFGANSPVLEAFRAKFLGQDVVIGNPAANMLLSGSEPIGVALNTVADGLNNGSMTITGMFETLSKAAKDQIASGRSMEAIAPFSDFAKTMTDISEGSLALAKRHQEVVTKFNGDYAAFFKAQETNLDKTSKGIISLGMATEDVGKFTRNALNEATKSSLGLITDVVSGVQAAITKALGDDTYMSSIKDTSKNMTALAGSSNGLAIAFAKLKDAMPKLFGVAASGSDDVAKAGGALAGVKEASKKAALEVAESSAGTMSKFFRGIPLIASLVDGGLTGLDAHKSGKSVGGSAVEGGLTAGASFFGGLAGAKYGAALGIAGGPIGMLLGGLLGGGLGAFTAGKGGELVGELLTGGGDLKDSLFNMLGIGDKPAGFAQGGMVRQPSLAMIGDRNISNSEGEVVIPFGKSGVRADIDLSAINNLSDNVGKLVSALSKQGDTSEELLYEFRAGNRISSQINKRLA